jgi:import receptor subunit TOM22
MVLVEEVKEDIIDRESDYETESDISDNDSIFSEDDFDPSSETIYDRIAALKDVVSPETRSSVTSTVSGVKGWATWAFGAGGQLAWWATTSALLIGLPLALAIEDEARITQQEREMQMQNAGQQQVSIYRDGAEHVLRANHLSSWAAPLVPPRAALFPPASKQ